MSLLRQTIVVTALLSLGGCALHFVPRAGEDDRSDGLTTVVSGRVLYEVDGRSMVPYDQPGWAVPRFMGLSLTSGDPYAFGETASDGSFRVRVPPGAYVITRFGVSDTESELMWPRLVMCVPQATGTQVRVGTIRLSGQRYANEEVLSTGRRYTSRGVRYTIDVLDDAPAGATRRPVRLVPDMPIGESLQRRWLADAAGLERELCGTLARPQ